MMVYEKILLKAEVNIFFKNNTPQFYIPVYVRMALIFTYFPMAGDSLPHVLYEICEYQRDISRYLFVNFLLINNVYYYIPVFIIRC